MNKDLLKKVGNIFCYTVTAFVFGVILWIVFAPPSQDGIEYEQCMDTARTLAPDADTKYLIQRGCFGNYLIKVGHKVQEL